MKIYGEYNLGDILIVCFLLAMLFLIGNILYVARLRTDYCDKGNHEFTCKICGEELIKEEQEMSSNWYLVSSKEDDYGGCRRELVKCKKSNLKNVYHHVGVPEEDLEVLKKYFDVVNDFVDGEDELIEYLEVHFE